MVAKNKNKINSVLDPLLLECDIFAKTSYQWCQIGGALRDDAGGEILLNKKMSKSIDDMVRVGN